MKDNWTEQLKEINAFFQETRTLEEIDNFLTERNVWVNPMKGINLAGKSKVGLLIKAKDLSAQSSLASATGRASKYKDYNALHSSPDGNCFFNAFSILLNGDESLATRLRLALCLGIMKREFKGINAFEAATGFIQPELTAADINDKIPALSSESNYDGWAEIRDIAYVSELFKRPIRVIYKPPIAGLDPTKNAYKELQTTGGFAWSSYVSQVRDSDQLIIEHKEWFTIFHVHGNHFVPLIHLTLREEITDADLDKHDFTLISFFMEEAVLIPGEEGISEPELIINLTKKRLDENDIVLEDWQNKEVKTIVITGSIETLQTEYAKLTSALDNKWSISGAVAVNFTDQRITFSPGVELHKQEEKKRPKTPEPPPEPTLEEKTITNVLTILDGWKDKVEGQEKQDIKLAIVRLANNIGTKLGQFDAVQNLLTNYPSFKSNQLDSYLETWEGFLPERSEKDEEELPPLSPSRPDTPLFEDDDKDKEETNIHQKTHKLLQDWHDKTIGETKKELAWILKRIKQFQDREISDDKENITSLYQRLLALFNKYPEFKGSVLEGFLETIKTDYNIEESDLEEMVPDWLFPEEPEKPPQPDKLPHTPKPPKPPKEKPNECRICEKNTFYSKAEFIKAHGVPSRGEPSIWVYTKKQIMKKPVVYSYNWLCKACKQEYHTDKCKYYSPPKPIIPKPEIFDWDAYWKWWFGVMTLDWESPRFFGEKKTPPAHN